jgi:hypothetical protein
MEEGYEVLFPPMVRIEFIQLLGFSLVRYRQYLISRLISCSGLIHCPIHDKIGKLE